MLSAGPCKVISPTLLSDRTAKRVSHLIQKGLPVELSDGSRYSARVLVEVLGYRMRRLSMTRADVLSLGAHLEQDVDGWCGLEEEEGGA